MSLQQARLITSIQTLFRNDERLIYFFFHHMKAELRLGAAELLDEAKALSRGEYLLILTALDFWNGEGHLRLADALKSLDDESLLAFVRAILCWREIDIEYLLDDELC